MLLKKKSASSDLLLISPESRQENLHQDVGGQETVTKPESRFILLQACSRETRSVQQQVCCSRRAAAVLQASSECRQRAAAPQTLLEFVFLPSVSVLFVHQMLEVTAAAAGCTSSHVHWLFHHLPPVPQQSRRIRAAPRRGVKTAK